MNIVLTTILIGSLQITAYRSVLRQTDSTPFYTSTGERVTPDGIALSWDLLCGACRKNHRRCNHPEYDKKVHYGDWVYINGVGLKRVFDIMNKRHNNRLDIWVSSKNDESNVFNKFKNKKIEVYKVVFNFEQNQRTQNGHN